MKKTAIKSLHMENMSFGYPDAPLLFKDLNLQFPMGEIVWLRGASGSGKSVLLKMLAGLTMPTAGNYRVNNEIVNEMSFEEFVPYRCNMGYSFDFGGLINNRDIIGNLLLIFEYHDFALGAPGDFVNRISRYMKAFELESVAKLRPSAVIGGQRKAACVARAFVHNPQVLLLDDPTTGLRGEVKQNLKELIQSKKATGEAQHTFIASDDVEFMKSFNPVVIDIQNGEVHIQQERRVA